MVAKSSQQCHSDAGRGASNNKGSSSHSQKAGHSNTSTNKCGSSSQKAGTNKGGSSSSSSQKATGHVVASTNSSANKSSNSNSKSVQISKATSHICKTHKASEFVDKTTGRLGFKEETKYCRTDNYTDKVKGYSHQFQTQLNLKHVAVPLPTDNKTAYKIKHINN